MRVLLLFDAVDLSRKYVWEVAFDKITNIKLTESINQIGNLTKGKVVDEKQVLTLMRYYELIKEIKNVHKTWNS